MPEGKRCRQESPVLNLQALERGRYKGENDAMPTHATRNTSVASKLVGLITRITVVGPVWECRNV